MVGRGAVWAELARHLFSRVPEKVVDRKVLTPLQKLPKRVGRSCWLLDMQLVT